jgi:hypothetical protein
MSNSILSADELHRLTGYKRARERIYAEPELSRQDGSSGP